VCAADLGGAAGAFKPNNLGYASATPYHLVASIFHYGDVSRIFTAIVSYL
jgi:hypothetical protein